MSDFTSDFWSLFVAIGSLLSIAACLLMLWVTARKKIVSADDNTTGHVWDGDLREMNNPLPRWWMWLFVITVLFAFGYLYAYPGLGRFGGQMGWSTSSEYQKEMADADKALEPMVARFAAMPPEVIAGDPEGMAMAERLFMNNCAQCHGSDAKGSKGFPNLSDGDWLYGGAPAKLVETITAGRNGAMPPMGAAIGTSEDSRNVANYVLSLSSSPHDEARAALGRPKFAVCAACHGVEGKGNPLLGAPNLADNVWLHGYGEAAIVSMIGSGKTSHMPAQGDKLTETQIKLLASYVWGMSNKPQQASR
ncbi:cytochrome-c oxidase, cbb3-type subunit III [soil metagenome]